MKSQRMKLPLSIAFLGPQKLTHQNKPMKIAIIGLGYVGLPLSLQFVESGVEVIGLDVDAEKVASLERGRTYIKHITDSAISKAMSEGRFQASTDFARVAEVEAVIVCVPTPLNKHREPDVSYVLSTGRSIAPYLGENGRGSRVDAAVAATSDGHYLSNGDWRGTGEASLAAVIHNPDPAPVFGNGSNGTHNGARRAKLVVLESTTYPGTTDEDFRAVLEKESGLKAGTDFHLAFSPEREDPANPMSRVATIPKVVGGYSPECARRAVDLYGRAIETIVPVSSCRAAEATKLLENIFRSVNIALVNELKVVYEAMGIDIWEVIDAAKTKPFGFMPFYPGPGLGGHCIPIDPFYLTWKAREFGQHTRFIELAGEINAGMGTHVVKRITETLNQHGRPLRESRVLLVGLAYKADVDDMRESPTFVLMDQLTARGAEVSYFDPWIPEIHPTREHERWTGIQSIEWNRESLASFDCVVICTAHSSIDFREMGEWCDCIVDTRNAMAKAGVNGGNVVKA